MMDKKFIVLQPENAANEYGLCHEKNDLKDTVLDAGAFLVCFDLDKLAGSSLQPAFFPDCIIIQQDDEDSTGEQDHCYFNSMGYEIAYSPSWDAQRESVASDRSKDHHVDVHCLTLSALHRRICNYALTSPHIVPSFSPTDALFDRNVIGTIFSFI
jgi:hypothetical protein